MKNESMSEEKKDQDKAHGQYFDEDIANIDTGVPSGNMVQDYISQKKMEFGAKISDITAKFWPFKISQWWCWTLTFIRLSQIIHCTKISFNGI